MWIDPKTRSSVSLSVLPTSSFLCIYRYLLVLSGRGRAVWSEKLTIEHTVFYSDHINSKTIEIFLWLVIHLLFFNCTCSVHWPNWHGFFVFDSIKTKHMAHCQVEHFPFCLRREMVSKYLETSYSRLFFARATTQGNVWKLLFLSETEWELLNRVSRHFHELFARAKNICSLL